MHNNVVAHLKKTKNITEMTYKISFIIGLVFFLIGQIIMSKGNDFVYAQEPIDFAHWFLLVGVVSIGQSFEMSSLIEKEKNGIVEGIVLDKVADNEPLIFATVTVKELDKQVETQKVLKYSQLRMVKLLFQLLTYRRAKMRNVTVDLFQKSAIVLQSANADVMLQK